MVLYEVNLRVANEIAEDAAVWLRGHIDQMLRIEGFQRAAWYYQNPEAHIQQWTVVYHVSKWKLLERYFGTQAAEMRKEALDRFGDRIQAGRRVLFERETFE
jgi:hypothetical protein